METLKNKVAVVFAASGEIAGAVARSFAQHGAKVYVTGRNLTAVKALADEIKAGGGQAEAGKVMSFFFWLMGLSPITPPHVDARDISLGIFCKLHVDILIENEFVVGYRNQFKDLIASLGISAVKARLVSIEDQSALVCPDRGG